MFPLVPSNPATVNIFGSYKAAARFALAVLLMFTSQLVLAGQLCHAIMAGRIAAVHGVDRGGGISATEPCCTGAPLEQVDCASASVSEPQAVTSSVATGQFDGAAPPAATGVARPEVRLVVATRVAAPPAPAIPAYILFGRYLS